MLSLLRRVHAQSLEASHGHLTFLARQGSTKVYPSVAAAVAVVKSGDVLLGGGFGLCGLPNTLYNALAARQTTVRGLTAVSNNAGAGGFKAGLTTLLQAGQLSKIIMSYVGT